MEHRIASRGTAVVTGAATGIGAAICRRLAQQGMDLVLVARDAARLESAAERLRAEHGVGALVVPLDLSLPDAPAQLMERLHRDGIVVEVLVNNAGASLVGAVAETPPEKLSALVDLNARAVAVLTALTLPDMMSRGHGAVVNIASTAAHGPAPYSAAYAAAKAFVLSFTQAVWAETRGTGVRVVAVSPGSVKTPMNPDRTPGQRSPDMFADTVMKALRSNAPSVVDGWAFAVQAFLFGRVLPVRVTARITGRFFSGVGKLAKPPVHKRFS
ncbi:SDR family NAD(P)-dependent oxidoreductase [Streptomyces werraensis]|uniref:SDR family NAD(P)-dependent oxidoreductase n=1 Tax=Streptomyces werraensis TaxID=68284 RepID=UPI001CE3168D